MLNSVSRLARVLSMRSWILGRRWEGRLWSASWELSKTADKMGVVRR